MENPVKSATLDLNLSRRLYCALTVGTESMYQVLDDPSMEVLFALLKNPALNNNHLLALLKRRDLSEDLLKAVGRLEKVAASHELSVALARNPRVPGALMVSLLPRLYLFELVEICYLPGVTPDQKIAAERAIIQRLPTTPLGTKITLVRRGTAAIAEALIRDSDSRLMEACLSSPHLKESAVFKFLGSANATAETISMVARHPRWKGRVNLQLAILKNQKTPAVWFTLFLPHLSLTDVKGLLLSQRLSRAQKNLVVEELKRRGQFIRGVQLRGISSPFT
jgi:hypothetical protein